MRFNPFNKRFTNTWHNVSKLILSFRDYENDSIDFNEISQFNIVKEKTKNNILTPIKELNNDLIIKTHFFKELSLLNYSCQQLLELLELSKTKEELQIIELSMEKIILEINKFKEKKNIEKNIGLSFTKLKNPIGLREYKLLMIHTASNSKRSCFIKKVQLRLIYTLLFYTGLSISVLRTISRENIFQSIETGELIFSNDNCFFLEKNGQNALKALETNLTEIFYNHDLKFVGSSIRNKETFMSEKTLINLISLDMKYCLKDIAKLDGKYSSDHFRKSLMGRLLLVTNFDTMKQIINGNHHQLNKMDILNILSNAFQLPN